MERYRHLSFRGAFYLNLDWVGYVEHSHGKRVEQFAVYGLQDAPVVFVLGFCVADLKSEIANRLRQDPAPLQPGDGGHPGVVPASDKFLFDQRPELTFLYRGSLEVEP